jgi:hypothetical protein
MVASRRAISEGHRSSESEIGTFTDLVFCKMNTKISASTTAPAMMRIQAA